MVANGLHLKRIPFSGVRLRSTGNVKCDGSIVLDILHGERPARLLLECVQLRERNFSIGEMENQNRSLTSSVRVKPPCSKERVEPTLWGLPVVEAGTLPNQAVSRTKALLGP